MRPVSFACFAALIALAVTADSRAVTFSEIPSYYDHLNFNLTSPTALTTAAGGYANPGVYAAMPGAEVQWYGDRLVASPVGGLPRWGGFFSAGGIGGGAIHERVAIPGGGIASVTDWRVAVSSGNARSSFGVALGWSTGDESFFRRRTVLQLGYVGRVGRYGSLGASGIFSMENNDASGLFDMAVRPLGDRRLTVFADAEYAKGYSFGRAWSAGAMLEVPAGIKWIARYFRDNRRASPDRVSVALAYTLGAGSGGSLVRASAEPFYQGGDHTGTSYGVRVGYAERNGLLAHRARASRYVKLHLLGQVKNSRYRYFDNGILMSDLMEALDGARTDPAVAGVALSLSGTVISPGNAWELREKLSSLRRAGKRVVVFFDNAGMSTYHIASVADYIVMDTQGMLVLPGYAMGRTYLKRLADRLGLGIEEWRFTDYKSAMESLVRTNMSKEDREQRQALTDGYYQVFREDVASGRSVDENVVDHWINDVTLFTPRTARSEGLVDTLGRFSDVDAIVRSLEHGARRMIGPRQTRRFAFANTEWGRNPEIAVVYALGECAMDSGIHARNLERQIDRIARDARVAAVVLRVNSPGGSPLASDLVAKAVTRCRKHKPVVVSQADVAASGGYWLSMTADEIVAQPTTITGSIGLIGGWVWDNGFSNRIHVNEDFVKTGVHSDLFVDVRIPLLGIGVPHRRVTDSERTQILAGMKSMYEEFVDGVARGRHMDRAHAGRVARGRVWTGLQGLDNGLVDRIGGLDTAIAAARERAGIRSPRDVTVVHYNEKGLFDLAGLRPRWLGFVRGRVRLGRHSALFSLGPAATADIDSPGESPRGIGRTRGLAPGSPVVGTADALSWFLRLPRNADVAMANATLFPALYDVAYLAELARYAGRARCVLPADFIPRTAFHSDNNN